MGIKKNYPNISKLFIKYIDRAMAMYLNMNYSLNKN